MVDMFTALDNERSPRKHVSAHMWNMGKTA